jgi:hypothetical protein
MTRIYWTNHSRYSDRKFVHFWDALTHAKSVGFEARLDVDGKAVASWSPIGGLRYL